VISIDPLDVLDDCIAIRLASLERRLRTDLAATGPEDEDALDLVPNPDAPWRRVTVEEVLVIERARLESLRDRLLASGMR